MTGRTATQIIELEEQLRQAMLASDVPVLDELLASDILITSHFGELLQKQDDLAAHESGLIKIHELNPSEQRIQFHGDVAIVSVRMQIVGDYDGRSANGDYRFTRVWAVSASGTWQIVAAHISTVV
jgi:ketosteroid isomerase-like protein